MHVGSSEMIRLDRVGVVFGAARSSVWPSSADAFGLGHNFLDGGFNVNWLMNYKRLRIPRERQALYWLSNR